MAPKVLVLTRELTVVKQQTNLLLITLLSIAFSTKAKSPEVQINVWDNAYNAETKQRFIPVELFTGADWDGKHQLNLNEVTTTACYSVIGRDRPCDPVKLTGPYWTESNETKIEWAEEQVPYYIRKFQIRDEQIESHFTINNSRDGMVRIFDKRKRWGIRTYDRLGSKFPLGYWKQGEVRTYPSKRPTRIEILELNGPEHCLTFRWVVGDGQRRNQDNNYTFCPNRGFTAYQSNYKQKTQKQ